MSVLVCCYDLWLYDRVQSELADLHLLRRSDLLKGNSHCGHTLLLLLWDQSAESMAKIDRQVTRATLNVQDPPQLPLALVIVLTCGCVKQNINVVVTSTDQPTTM